MRAHLLRFTIPLVAASVAQAQLPPIRFDYNDETPWPTGVTAPTSFSRALAGDFDGNGLMDAVVLEQESAGGKVVYYPQPDSWPFQTIAWQTNGPLVNDIDVIPPSGAMPAQLALVSANGLDRLLYAADGTYPVNGGRMGLYFAWAPIDHGALWQGAKLVRTGQLDAGGTDLDYVGVKDTVNASTQQLESTVIVRQKIGTTTTTISFTLPGVVVHDAFIGQWNDTPDNEIFLLDTSGVEIYTPAGVRVRRFVRPYADDGKDAFCGFKKNIVVNDQQVADPKLHVAWFRRKIVTVNTENTDHQELVELNAPATTIATGIEVDYGTRVVCAVAGDSPLLVNGTYAPADGNQELAVQVRNWAGTLVYVNVGPTTGYSSGNPTPPDPSHPLASFVDVDGYTLPVNGDNPGSPLLEWSGADVMAPPIYADISGDGIADMATAVCSLDGSVAHALLQLHRGSKAVTSQGTPPLYVSTDGYLDASEFATNTTVGGYSYANPPVGKGVELKLALADMSPPSGTNGIQIVTWERDLSTGSYTSLGSDANGYYNYSGATSGSLTVRVPIPTSLWVTTGTLLFNGKQYVYEVRFVQVSGAAVSVLGTNNIIVLGQNYADTLDLTTPGFSTISCVLNLAGSCTGSGCSAYNCQCPPCPPATQPISGPVAITRRRFPAPPGGGSPQIPAAPAPTNYLPGGSLPVGS